MKIINKLFTGKNAAEPESTSVRFIIGASVNAAFKYAGLTEEQGTVISAKFAEDGTGSWCAVTFLDDSTACRMNYTAYVDVYTGEVCGFSGEADKTWLDYPESCDADVDTIYAYPVLAIAG